MDMQAIHNVLILLHAAAATIYFFAGCLLIFVRAYTANQGLFGFYWCSWIGVIVLLMRDILVDWTKFEDIERIVFPGLFVLGSTCSIARSANQLLKTQQNDWKHNYMEHIGFTLISLFEGFISVRGLNAGIPGWLVGLAGQRSER